jgi:hypothetical protein
MNLPFQESEWHTDALQLIHESCTIDVDRAVEAVTLRYLDEGDWHPLMDAFQRGHQHTKEVMAHLAAMLEPEHRAKCSVRCEFVFSIGRKRTKRVVFRNGARELAHGNDPGSLFWRCLFAALDENYRHDKQMETFLVRATVRPIGGGRGKLSNPGLQRRDTVVAWMVEQSMSRGNKYEIALKDVAATIQADAKAQGGKSRQGSISWQTVKKAYEGHAKASRQK